jgi:Tfp pilus assembly protein PilN
MPIINLIQEQRIADQKRDQGVRMAMFTCMATVAFGVLGYGILMFEQQASQAEISRLNQEIEANKPIVARIDDTTKQEDALKPRLTTLGEAQKVTDKWADILKHLQTQTPQDTWLTGLQTPAVTDDKPITLVFTGTARAQEPVSEFILRQQNQPFLANVTLHFTQAKRAMQNGKFIDFEMGAEILDSATQKKVTKEDQKL